MGDTAESISSRIGACCSHLIAALRDRFADSTLIAAAGVVIVVIGAGLGVLVLAPQGRETELPQSPPVFESVTSTSTTQLQVLVHAAGAVRHPGLHSLPSGSRVADLIEAAGGVDDTVDIDRINLAAPVSDGERVWLPRRGEPVPAQLTSPSDVSGDAADESRPLDLNTATQQQLDELPGVGPATAAAILAERKSRGRFASVEDLLDVRGIGTAKLEEIRSLVTTR